MQEIEFRGKAKGCLWSIENESDWVYGLPSYNGNGKIAEIESKDNHLFVLIDPVTLSQYIGIKDIHQKKVFRGDIVKVKQIIYTNCWRNEVEEIREYTGEVVWFQFGWYVAEKVKEKIQGKTYEATRYHSLWLWNVKDDETEPDKDFMEIIGDRWSNPEMKVIE